MDYEKKYDDALAKARVLYERLCSESLKDDLAGIFPELRESKDERIRKEIIDFLETIPASELKRIPRPISEWFSWLEKQKEPHYTKRNALFDKCVAECDPEVMKEVSDKVDEMLRKEQKSSVWESPIMTHEMIMEKQKEQKPKPNYCHYGGDPNVERCKYCSAACIGRLAEEQKTAEMNTEKIVDEIGKGIRQKWASDFVRWLDKNRYEGKMCVSNAECRDIEDAFVMADWDKLRRYYHKYVQPPVEWSEEDERMLSRCIKSIETSKQFADSETFKEAKDKEIDWFKSLPERLASTLPQRTTLCSS